MKKLYILPIIMAFLFVGCAKENPFVINGDEETGSFYKSALSMNLASDDMVKRQIQTRAEVSPNDFNIVFSKVGSSVPVLTIKYADMPNVVTLPTGDYKCIATYGEDRLAEWECPFYLGSSEEFTINPYEITSYIDPIVCKLENIKVTIDFDPVLRQKMSEDSFVEVKVGSNSGLKYTTTHSDNGTAGYFRHNNENTLVAVFNGKVDGVLAVETKSLKNIAKGNHYKITFKLHNHDGDDTGDNDADIKVDASVIVTNIERNVNIGDETLLDDDERPTEDPKDDPNPANDPPVIKGVAPIDLDKVNTIDGSVAVEMIATSSAAGGFIAFDVEIISEALTPEALEEVGLAAHLNLAETPEGMVYPLTNFGFPVNVKGQKVANLKIDTTLLAMLAAVGSGMQHEFKITITDANGTTEKSLKLFIP